MVFVFLHHIHAVWSLQHQSQKLEGGRLGPSWCSALLLSSSNDDWTTLFGQCLFLDIFVPFSLARVTSAHRKWAGVAPPGQWNRCTMGCTKLHAIKMSSNIGNTKSDRQNLNFEKKEWFRSARSFLGWWSCVTTMKKRWLPTSRLCLFQTFDTSEADSGHTWHHVTVYDSSLKRGTSSPHWYHLQNRPTPGSHLSFCIIFCKQTKPQKASLEKLSFPNGSRLWPWTLPLAAVEFVDFENFDSKFWDQKWEIEKFRT